MRNETAFLGSHAPAPPPDRPLRRWRRGAEWERPAAGPRVTNGAQRGHGGRQGRTDCGTGTGPCGTGDRASGRMGRHRDEEEAFGGEVAAWRGTKPQKTESNVSEQQRGPRPGSGTEKDGRRWCAMDTRVLFLVPRFPSTGAASDPCSRTRQAPRLWVREGHRRTDDATRGDARREAH